MIRLWLRRVRRSLLGTGATIALAAAALTGTAVPSQAAAQQPCDIYAAGGTPCVAAHSTVRALYASYSGSLYQVRRSSDNTTREIGVVAASGRADASAQDAFCAGTSCVITTVHDQSGHGNDLQYQGPGGAGGSDTPANATSESLTVGGGKVYSLYINPGNSYWRDGHLTGVPTGSAPEGAYMVTSGTHVNKGCCFDYGNSETDRKADGAGAMDAIYFGTSCWFGGCSGSGPWVQADLEYGLYPGGSQSWNSNQRAFTSKYVTAMLKNNGTSRFAIKGADAQSGGLTTLWDGALPGGYSPMKKQGAIVLGSGGDCCNGNTNQSLGTFYEGAIVSGYPSDATDNAVQANISAAGYGGSSSGGGSGSLTPGSRISLQATTSCCTADYVKHDDNDNNVVIANISSSSSATDKGDATWIVRAGLSNSSCVSFESANKSGQYLRHQNYQLHLTGNDGSSTFSQDATFCPQSGHNGQGYSFQSVNFTNRYLRHYAYTVYIASNGGSNAFDSATSWNDDTSWNIATPWS
ncbi:alpha-L-arabinofuranosidase B [Streptacidiphilus griseoplanus]|uniref:alpha-L-arabinofuranosidase B n=1 Tax=Peterkaempfera griseoplana TaxID=66896 RepID=UPI000B11A931|nr:alpha-L-arabinofuranosidase B [Peterkaempfera griseoplana]